MSILYSEDLYWVEDIKRCHYQITKISSSDLDVVNLYGSDGADTDQFLEDLFCLISCKETFLVGDFNRCFKSEYFHPVFQALNGYEQLVKNPTHVQGRL